MKSRIFNNSIDSSSLNNFSSSFLHLLQIIERTNFFSKRYDILGFSNFLYLPQILQYYFFIFLVIENILVLYYHSSRNHCEKINLHTLMNVYPISCSKFRWLTMCII